LSGRDEEDNTFLALVVPPLDDDDDFSLLAVASATDNAAATSRAVILDPFDDDATAVGGAGGRNETTEVLSGSASVAVFSDFIFLVLGFVATIRTVVDGFRFGTADRDDVLPPKSGSSSSPASASKSRLGLGTVPKPVGLRNCVSFFTFTLLLQPMSAGATIVWALSSGARCSGLTTACAEAADDRGEAGFLVVSVVDSFSISFGCVVQVGVDDSRLERLRFNAGARSIAAAVDGRGGSSGINTANNFS
jgi:hypothetical protein